MKKIQLIPPALRDVLGIQAEDYPSGFMWPYTVLVREAWTRHRKAVKAEPVEFTIPQYGVLTMHGREYKLIPTASYAAQKGYADTIEGTWG